MASNVIKLLESNFDQELKSDLPVLIDFWAEWCVPCKALSGIIDEISEKYEGKLKVCKANVDENINKTKEYSLSCVPAIFIIKNGEIVKKRLGLQTKKDIIKDIEEVLNSQ